MEINDIIAKLYKQNNQKTRVELGHEKFSFSNPMNMNGVYPISPQANTDFSLIHRVNGSINNELFSQSANNMPHSFHKLNNLENKLQNTKNFNNNSQNHNNINSCSNFQPFYSINESPLLQNNQQPVSFDVDIKNQNEQKIITSHQTLVQNNKLPLLPSPPNFQQQKMSNSKTYPNSDQQHVFAQSESYLNLMRNQNFQQSKLISRLSNRNKNSFPISPAVDELKSVQPNFSQSTAARQQQNVNLYNNNQRLQDIKTSKMDQIYQADNELSNLSLEKKTIKKYSSDKQLVFYKDINEKIANQVLFFFKKELLDRQTQNITDRLSYNDCCYLYTIITLYFQHLQQRLKLESIDYINLIHAREYSYDDFLSYDEQFFKFVYESTFFSLEKITEYSLIYHDYQKLLPEDIRLFRLKLLELKHDLYLNKDDIDRSCLVDYSMVTYQELDLKYLYELINESLAYRDQFEVFIEKFSLSSEIRENLLKFVKCFENALKSQFGCYSPTVYTFGSFTNGLSTYNSDLDIFVKFEKITSDVLDFNTSVLALEVIEQIIKKKMRAQLENNNTCIVYSRRCPIIKLNFRHCFHHLQRQIPQNLLLSTKFSKSDISLGSIYGVHNSQMLKFLTEYDQRFYEMTMVLKYWAKKNELISQQTFSTYAFTMLIIFFLQQQQPPILPTVIELQRLSHSSELKVHKWNFEICKDLNEIEPSQNTKLTQTLFVEFFRFYASFDFFVNALRPRDGTKILKWDLYQEKNSSNLKLFNMSSYFCIEDPFVLDHNVAYNFRTKYIMKFHRCFIAMADRMTEINCLKMLLKPNDLRLSIPNYVYPSSNFNFFELYYDKTMKKYSLRALETSFDDPNTLIDCLSSILLEFFVHILRHLFRQYFMIKKFDIRIFHNREIRCSGQAYGLERVIRSNSHQELNLILNSNGKTDKYITHIRNLTKIERQKFLTNSGEPVSAGSDQERNQMQDFFRIEIFKQRYKFLYFQFKNFDRKYHPLWESTRKLLQKFMHLIDRNESIESFNDFYHLFVSK